MDRILLFASYRRGEHREQIGAPDRQIGKPIAFDRLGPEVEELSGVAGLPVTYLLALGLGGQRRKLFENSHGAERAGSVRAQLHPGPYLLELLRPLADIDLEPALQQGEGGRHPPIPAPAIST